MQAASVDPTRPFDQSASKGALPGKNKLVLESIVHGNGIHTVVINGKVLKPKETIGQYQLLAVNDDSVILQSATERLKLYVFKASVLKVDD